MGQVKATNVAIAGGGSGCKAIMDMIFGDRLSGLRMKLIGVADLNPQATGYRYAWGKGIYTTTDYHELYKLKDLNMIIEITGDEKVAQEIFQTKPNHVRFLDHIAARLFWDIFQIEEERIAERKEAEKALQKAHAELEARVKERTEELAKANKELQTEITERRQAEEELRKTRDYMENLIDCANAPIIVWDPEGIITLFNTAFERIIGYRAEEVVGKPLASIFDGRAEKESLMKIEQSLKGQRWESVEISAFCKDGKERILLCNSANIYAPDGKTQIATIVQGQDITGRKQMEEQLKTSLAEKEVLLKEIHHRVKNNLQIICSMLYLQSKDIKDAQSLDIFSESQHRVRSIALAHEQLYQSKNLAKIEFAEYIRNLSGYLFNSYGVNSNIIALKTNLQSVFLKIDRAIPCALIINELISNSLKHAFPAGRERGEIYIEFRSDNEDNVTLIVSDNGVGFPRDLDFRDTSSFGLRLVNILVTQLNGAIELDVNHGTTFRITFPSSRFTVPSSGLKTVNPEP